MNPNPAFRLARKGSLQRKIIAWSFVPAVLIMLVVALVNFQAYIRVTEDLVLQRNRELARLKAAQLSTELLELRTLLDRQSSYLGRVGLKAFYSISNTSRRQELLQVFNAGVVVLNDRGSILAAAPEEHYPEGSDWSQTAIFNQVRMRSEPRPAISDILPIGPDGKPVIALAVPVMDPQGKYLGMLIGLMALEPSGGLYDSIGSLRLQRHGEAILVDGQGLVIYPPDPANPAADLSTNPTVQQVQAGMVGSLRTRDAAGNDIVASFAPVMGTRWGLITQENWTSLLGSSQNYIWFLMGLLLLGVVLPTVVVTLGVRRITRPIAELALAAHEVAAGKFGRVVHAPTNDEVEELAIQFNSMAYQLQESYGRLEQRVEERTRQLATLNRISSVVSRTLDLADILESALETSAEAMRMEAGWCTCWKTAGWP
jgi:HAMP domain-containing protein